MIFPFCIPPYPLPVIYDCSFENEIGVSYSRPMYNLANLPHAHLYIYLYMYIYISRYIYLYIYIYKKKKEQAEPLSGPHFILNQTSLTFHLSNLQQDIILKYQHFKKLNLNCITSSHPHPLLLVTVAAHFFQALFRAHLKWIHLRVTSRALDKGLLCRKSNSRNGNDPRRYFCNLHVNFKIAKYCLSNLRKGPSQVGSIFSHVDKLHVTCRF